MMGLSGVAFRIKSARANRGHPSFTCEKFSLAQSDEKRRTKQRLAMASLVVEQTSEGVWCKFDSRFQHKV